VASIGTDMITRIDPRTDMITRIDPRTDKVAATIAIPDGPGWMSYGEGSLWVCGFHQGSVLRIDPTTGKTLKRFALGANAAQHCAAITALDNTVWAEALIGDDGEITGSLMYRIDPATNTLGATPAPMPDSLGEGVALDGQQAWVYSTTSLYRVDPQTNQVMGTFAVLGGNGIALGDGSVWLATTDQNSDTGTLLRITPTH
jgi:virginiamycin B lyase